LVHLEQIFEISEKVERLVAGLAFYGYLEVFQEGSDLDRLLEVLFVVVLDYGDLFV
jgi:hypothetical protein